MIERREITDIEQWLGWREEDVLTCSGFGALDPNNDHPSETHLRLHLKGRGVQFPRVERNNAMRRGNWFEPAVAKAVEELRPDWKLSPVKAYYRHLDPLFAGTPDFMIDGDPRGRGTLQAKTTNPAALEKHWLGGTQPPRWIVWQTRGEMILTEAAFGAIAVLKVDAFDVDCHIFELERDQAVEAMMIERVREFWQQVREGREPAPDFARDAEVINAMFPAEKAGRTLDLSGDNHLPMLLDERVTLQANVKDMEKRVDEIDAELKYRLQDAESATLPGWRLTFKSTDRAGYTVAPKTIRSLRVFDKRTA